MLAPGDRIDRYEIVELLGRGGMGEVYRALDPRLDRHIALKIVPPDPELGTGGRARLLREARAVAALNHPNVLAVHDAGELAGPEAVRGLAYIAMELVVGSSLRASIGEASIAIRERVRWLRDVARGLAAAHEFGIVHRDVKPENVMIRFDGAVKVVDFGIARRDALPDSRGAHSMPTLRTGSVAITESAVAGPNSDLAGTLAYMAPEQLRGEAVDARVDQFAWGVMAYELVTGASPWKRAGTVTMVSQILSHSAPPAADVNAQVPRAVSDVIARAMAKNAADRFPSMNALVEALDDGSSSGAQVAAGPAPARRRRAYGALVAGLAVGAACLGFVAVAASRAHAPTTREIPRAAADRSPSAPGAPVACLPEAKKLYDRGIVEYETTSNARARRTWLEAVAVDPACAPAQLRIALCLEENGIALSDSRAAYIAARDHEDHLTGVERAIADAALPHFAADPSDADALESLRAVGERHPDEPFVFFLQGVIASNLGRADDARLALERTIAIRPKYQTAYAMLGYLAKSDGERAQWSARCLAETPHSIWCHALRADELEGGHDCAAFEGFARDYVATDPGPGAQVRLVEAFLATGAPREAVFEANRLSDDHSGGRAARNAALYGDYGPVETWLRQNADASKPDFERRASLAYLLSMVLDDTGRRREADAVVRSTYLASRAMTPSPASHVARFYERAMDAEVITHAEAVRALDEPLASTDPEAAFRKWIATARLSRTSAEARDAIAQMPPMPTLSTTSEDLESVGALEADMGRLHALAGDWNAARRYAESAVTRCDPAEWALGVVRAYALLGEACEKTGDVAGARAAYETVTRRWGQILPKAVHAERARARLAALGR